LGEEKKEKRKIIEFRKGVRTANTEGGEEKEPEET
jgi:hypothetical protein